MVQRWWSLRSRSSQGPQGSEPFRLEEYGLHSIRDDRLVFHRLIRHARIPLVVDLQGEDPGCEKDLGEQVC